MSNQVKNAIDMGLGGLYVSERDVAAIMRRVREPEKPLRRRSASWGAIAAVAAVMIMLVLGAGVRLLGGVRNVTPLDQPDTQTTYVPGAETTLLPVGSETTPAINIGKNEAIALAEAYINASYEPTDLRDGAVYEISCEWIAQAREGNTYYANFYEVAFRALNEYATAYTVWVRADGGEIISCECQRGAGEGHTAEEIYEGYARVYGEDRRMWTQEQLRTYVKMLKKAELGSTRWMDYLYMQTTYPDIAAEAMPKDEVIEAVLAPLQDGSVPMTDAAPVFGDGTVWKVQADARARYISAWPNPVWKVAVDLTVANAEGYESLQTLLVEVDSVTGDVQHMETVDALYSEQRESFLNSTIEALMQITTSGDNPSVDDYEAIAAAYVRDKWGETRDITDQSLFTLTVNDGDSPLTQCRYQLVYRSKGIGDQTEYVIYVDWYGQVVAANRGISSPSKDPFTPIAIALDWEKDSLTLWQEKARASAQMDDPIVQVFVNTQYTMDSHVAVTDEIEAAVCKEIGVRAATRTCAVKIAAEPNDVLKVAVESDQGAYLVELDSVTGDAISVMRVKGIYESWYLPFVLTAELQAAGIPLTWDVSVPCLDGATDDHGTNDGMRIDHLYVRFKQLYGADLADWTQEQLRSFQQMAILSSDYDNDLAVICLRNTVYPDVPDNAISEERAMLLAAEAIGLGADRSLCGAVLIGTADTPVWKTCLYGTRTARPGQEAGFWYAEVNCMTGEVLRIHQDAEGWAFPGETYDDGTPQNLWFRDIVLEETIEECDAVWDCKSNG